MDSLTALRFVPDNLLAARMSAVKELSATENEHYSLVKDTATGEHYLHFAARHLNIAAGSTEEYYHHFMPVEHDDVISLALGGDVPEYPGQWERPFLRNGPTGGYVWFDPDHMAEDAASYDAAAAQLREKLLAMKREGRTSEDDVRRLFEDVDRMFDDKRGDNTF